MRMQNPEAPLIQAIAAAVALSDQQFPNSASRAVTQRILSDAGAILAVYQTQAPAKTVPSAIAFHENLRVVDGIYPPAEEALFYAMIDVSREADALRLRIPKRAWWRARLGS
jgi:hypothetical protein